MKVKYAPGYKQQGLTLAEMMVAMTIGLVLLGGVVTVLLSSKNTYRVNEALARMQENARYAFQVLSRDVRMAGYRGCAGGTTLVFNTLDNATDFWGRMEQSLEGFEAGNTTWSPALPAGINQPLKGQDLLVLRGVEGSHAKVAVHDPDKRELEIKARKDFWRGLKDDSIVLVSNCSKTTVFKVNGFNCFLKDEDEDESADCENRNDNKLVYGEILYEGSIGGPFNKNNYGEIVRINTKVYYIRKKPDAVSSLYVKRGDYNAEELVEGIEGMQIEYGEREEGVLTYRTADQVGDWNNVVSVRIDLLMQSIEDGITTQPQRYKFSGQDFTATDRRLRQSFSTVISLRNRTS